MALCSQQSHGDVAGQLTGVYFQFVKGYIGLVLCQIGDHSQDGKGHPVCGGGLGDGSTFHLGGGGTKLPDDPCLHLAIVYKDIAGGYHAGESLAPLGQYSGGGIQCPLHQRIISGENGGFCVILPGDETGGVSKGGQVEVMLYRAGGYHQIFYRQTGIQASRHTGVDQNTHSKAVDEHLGGDSGGNLADAAFYHHHRFAGKAAFGEHPPCHHLLRGVGHPFGQIFHLGVHGSDDAVDIHKNAPFAPICYFAHSTIFFSGVQWFFTDRLHLMSECGIMLYIFVIQEGTLMPKGPNQKQKLLLLLDILQRQTDEEHPMTLEQLRQALAAQGVEAERKSLYDDLEQLRVYGADVLTVRDRTVRYYIGARTFDLAELRLLVDAVQSSRFITQRKSRELTEKLETLCSRHQAGQLQRQVLVTGRVKTMNESIYYNVDGLQAAISDNKQVTFRYFDWGMDKQRRLRREGALYQVSPWALTWDDENYYLIAYDATAGEIRHYRVDRMLNIAPAAENRQGEEAFRALDTAMYARKTFGMFGGQETPVTLRCAGWMTGVIVDRFGRDVTLFPQEDGFRVRVPVVVSPLFFAWLAGFGADIRVQEPAWVAEAYQQHLQTILASYPGQV